MKAPCFIGRLRITPRPAPVARIIPKSREAGPEARHAAQLQREEAEWRRFVAEFYNPFGF